jgi:tetratricopeptide (TPR) repeat protein
MPSIIFFHRIILVAVMVCAAVFGATEQEKVEAHDLLARANQSFSKANEAHEDDARRLYLEAASLYKQAARAGNIDNARLYYNIGNSYLLADDLGRAIYNYKKAVKLDSSDPLLQRNLAVARSKRLDRIDVRMERKVLSTLFFWHYDFSLRVRFYVAMAAFSLMMITATLKLWLKTFSGFTAVFVVLTLVFVCFSGSVAAEQINDKTHTEGVIVADELIARKGDSERYEKAFKDPLHSGTEFELVEKRPGWLRVRLADGSAVWLPEDGCKLL